MKKLLSCLLLFFSVITLYGCNNEQHMPEHKEEKLEELQENIGPNYQIDLYLGKYNGYYVWFDAEILLALGQVYVGEYKFIYPNTFHLYAYKDEVYDLREIYNDGKLSDKDIKQIYEYYCYALKNNLI